MVAPTFMLGSKFDRVRQSSLRCVQVLYQCHDADPRVLDSIVTCAEPSGCMALNLFDADEMVSDLPFRSYLAIVSFFGFGVSMFHRIKFQFAWLQCSQQRLTTDTLFSGCF